LKHILALLVVNRPKVLSHISGLVSRRGYNIDSIAAGRTEDPKVTRITLVVECEEDEIQQVENQLAKLVDVIKVTNLTREKCVVRELALIKVRASSERRSDIVDICNIFRAKIVDVTREAMIVELTGESDKIEALMDVLKEHGIVEIVRTGTISLARGPEAAKYVSREQCC